MSNIEAIMENANRLKKKHYKDGKANKVQTHVSPKI